MKLPLGFMSSIFGMNNVQFTGPGTPMDLDQQVKIIGMMSLLNLSTRDVYLPSLYQPLFQSGYFPSYLWHHRALSNEWRASSGIYSAT